VGSHPGHDHRPPSRRGDQESSEGRRNDVPARVGAVESDGGENDLARDQQGDVRRVMPRSYPPDVVVLDNDGLLHVRVARGRKNPQIVQAKTYSLKEGVFAPAVVTPDLVDEDALADVLRRVRMETGKWERVSILLPDSWFRINLVDLPSLSERGDRKS